MRTITAREANQGFSKLLAEVDAGAEVVITKRGKPVAVVKPFRKRLDDPERQAAIRRMVEMLERGADLGGLRATRDEMHER